MDLMDKLEHRRSVRVYNGLPIEEDELSQILRAGELAPTGHNRKSKILLVVRDHEMLLKLSECRVTGSAKMLAGADTAIVVLGDESVTDVWPEDCSLAMGYMHLMADDLGLGSCWIQVRNRMAGETETSDEYLRRYLNYPDEHKALAILSLGKIDRHPGKRTAPNVNTRVEYYE